MYTTATNKPFRTLYDWYHQMRVNQPVSHDPDSQVWNVFRYTDVAQVLSDYATFSSTRAPSDADAVEHNPLRSPIETTMIEMDPPRHNQLRGLVAQAFTPRMIAKLESRIASITNDLLDQVESQGEMDVIRDLAAPLPVTVIAELLGIPPSLHADFKRWSDAILASFEVTTNEDKQAFFQEIQPMFQAIMQVLELRRAHPQNDMMSDLLSASIDGQRLSDNELLGFCMLLLVAGNETTTTLIGNLLLCLDEHPEALVSLRADPQLVPAAIEEALRYYSPVKNMMRRTTREVTLSGQRIEADQMVCAWLGAANRDETEFPNADQFILARDPNRHLAFGRGIHFCLGAPLARLEATVALSIMLERLPGLWQVPAVPLEVIKSAGMLGTKNLPLIWGAEKV